MLFHCEAAPCTFVYQLEVLCIISLFIWYIIWGGRQGISVVGALHRGTSGVVLVYHKVICTKSLPVVINIFFHTKWKKMSSVKFLHLKIGPDIDLVCPTSSFFTNIVMTSNWMRAIRRPCIIQSRRSKLLSARICVCRLFRHQALTKIHR